MRTKTCILWALGIFLLHEVMPHGVANHWDSAGFNSATALSSGWGNLPSPAQRALVMLAVNSWAAPEKGPAEIRKSDTPTWVPN